MPKFSKEPLRGMDDLYPEDLREVNWIIDTLRDVAERYGFEEYETPQLEPIEIFAAKSSDELVYEQSFIVERKEGEKLILIPELTPSLARIVAKKSQELKKPIRWYSMPTCFRYERPQKGRRREFKQFNADILGEDGLYADLEIFNLIVDIFEEFGATSNQFQIYYNSRRFMDAICTIVLELDNQKLPFIYKVLDKSDKMEADEFEKLVTDSFQDKNIIQGVLKLKESKAVNDLLKKFNNIPDEFYNSQGYQELITFEKYLKEIGISDYCSFSSSVVRGLDYYTGIVYEVFDTGKENIRSIFGGGRYDDLLSLFSDEKISGTGFGMGVLMLSLFLETYQLIPKEVREKDFTDTIYIASVDESVSLYSFKIAQIVRKEEFPCLIDFRFKSLKSQLSKANDLGILITLIVGTKEMEENKVTLRNMKTEEQRTISIKNMIEQIYEILDESGE
ncbi:MAG: histidine--tRNA ligase [Candidatus Thorarchaeota archaeon]